jgi:hypothetical protein
MNDDLEFKLRQQLEILEKAHDRIYSTQGYSHEVERLRLLKELIGEQIQPRSKNEDTDHSTCSLR